MLIVDLQLSIFSVLRFICLFLILPVRLSHYISHSLYYLCVCVALSSQKLKPQKCVLVRLIFGGNNQILKVVYVLIVMWSCFKQEATPPTVFDQPLDSYEC